MNTVDIITQYIATLWIVSEILLSVIKRVKDRSRVYNKENSSIVWIINILSIIIGINIAARKEFGNISVDHRLISCVALLLILSGIIVRWIAIRKLRQHFTTSLTIIECHKLIKTGIYQYIRHPSYTGALMSFLGLSASFSNWASLFIIFVPILLNYLYRIKIEEKMLVNHFGTEYIEYAQKTSKLIPKLY